MIAKALRPKDAVYLLLISILALDGFRLLRLLLGIERINLSIYFCEMIIFYPLLGYSVDKFWDDIPWKKSKHTLLGIVSLIGISVAMLMTMREHAITQEWTENYITLFNTFMAVFTFVIMRILGDAIQKGEFARIQGVIRFLSGTMFGIYLLENMLRRWTRPLYLSVYSVMPQSLAVVLRIISIMLVGNVVVGALKCIPGVKKYI